MKNRTLLAAALAALMAASLGAFAEKQAMPKKQTTCPVMGEKINPAQYADVSEVRHSCSKFTEPLFQS